ncbi:MAG: ABC transporter substrate-binding protein [Chitinophagaceae bacterium]|nr:ABC transporter substrate-binding protein [Chitinophagaceae bacterium]
MNIGILFPRSNAHPLIGSEFTEALKAFLKKEGLGDAVNIHSESVGFGGVEKEVYGKAEKLLLMDNVDILIGFIDQKILELIKPLIQASGKLFILVNPGANHSLNWVPQENIITLCLQHSFLCALSGSIAAESGGKEIPGAAASSFYDCGYLHLSSITNEFTASGGKTMYHYINKQTYNDEFSIQELTGFLEANPSVTTLLCVFDSLPASLFYKMLNQYEHAQQLQLFVSPMMLEKKALGNVDKPFHFTINGYLPWHLSVPNSENSSFIQFYREHYRKDPGIFSLLGWEAGIIIKEIALSMETGYTTGINVIDLLKTKKISSPRGVLELDATTQYFTSPVIRCTIPAGSPVTELEFNIDAQNEWEQFTEKTTDGVVSGWTNTYLCY